MHEPRQVFIDGSRYVEDIGYRKPHSIETTSNGEAAFTGENERRAIGAHIAARLAGNELDRRAA